MKRIFLSVILAALPLAAQADEVTDALAAAQTAYAAGDLNGTAAQITTASKAILALQAAKLAGFLPEPPEGWTREVDASAAEGMALMGMAGNSVQARYEDAQGKAFTLTLTADSPLVAQMAGILGNPQMMAMMGKVVKVAGQDMLEQDGSLSALVGSRVLVQAQGADSATMQGVLGAVDFTGLAHYDS
ncbi:hypothetical protein [Gemmobacter serpentinus]|uniref:hypothetical protein n=1 Tax=Gemmobacter serpentinus TaxID=2652247 RepID=UPI00124D8381|nr:hypothetical protein [Gemmobacter serpentinus]